MRKLILVLLLLFPAVSHSQNWQSLEGPFGHVITGISKGLTEKIFAASYFDGIFMHKGGNWSKVYSAPGEVGWSCVEVLADQSVIAGRPALVVGSSDEGETWTVRMGNVENQSVGHFTLVSRLKDSIIMTYSAKEEYARTLVSDHLAQNWTIRLSDASNNNIVYAMAIDSLQVIVQCGHEYYSRSDDFLETMRSSSMEDPWRTVTALAADSSGRVWIAATDRSLRISSDAKTWKPIAQKLPDTLWSAAATPRGIAYVGSAEGVHTSTDGGQTWTEFNQGFPEGFIAAYLYIAPDGHLYVGTNGAGIFKTEKPVTGAYAVLPAQASVTRERRSEEVLVEGGRIVIRAAAGAELSFRDVLGRELSIPFTRTDRGFAIERTSLVRQVIFGLVRLDGETRIVKLPIE